MNKLIKLFLITSILFFQTISAHETEKVKVTSIKKNVQAIIGGETKNVLIDDELPLDAKILCDATGNMEFEYKKSNYKIAKGSIALLSDVIKVGGHKNSINTKKTDVAGVRALDKAKKKSKKNKSNEDN